MRRLARRAGLAAKALIVAMGLAGALPAPPAVATLGNMTARLGITSIAEERCGPPAPPQSICAARWASTVNARVPLGEPQVRDHRWYIAIRLWGDDPSSDDLLLGPTYIRYRLPSTAERAPCTDRGRSYFYAVPGALVIRGCLYTAKNLRVLDEDDSLADDGDEIYAGVRLLNQNGSTIRLAETNRIFRRF